MDYYNADVVALLQTLGESRKRHRLGQLQQIIENEPDNYAAHMEAGDIHGALGETRKSIACYQKAIHEPKYKNFAGVKLANAMIELRMFDLAEESLNEIELRAETREAEDFLKKMCYQAAESFRQEAMHDKAMKLYKKIFRVDAAYKDVVDKIEQLS
jgi:tetratricopeptide (TPR) repeat protein